MASQYTYTGYDSRGYFGYRDLETQRMLIAEPGGTYAIGAVNEGSPLPPGDGPWQAASPARKAPRAAEGGE